MNREHRIDLSDVPDYRLDPPASHTDDCACDECHSLHRDVGIEIFASLCRACVDELDGDLAAGVRCQHLKLIPYISDPRDRFPSMRTDVECPECQIDYGPAIAPVWLAILNREAA